MEGKLLLVLLFVGFCSAQIGLPCHNQIFQMTPRHSLDIPAFMGDWYMQEYALSDIGNTPVPARCHKIRLSHEPDNVLNITSREAWVDEGVEFADRTYITVNATRSPLSSVWKGEFMVGDKLMTNDMIVMAADLEFAEWMMFYACAIQENGYRYETMSIYTRSREMTPGLRSYTKALMVGSGFRIGDHKPIEQDNCP